MGTRTEARRYGDWTGGRSLPLSPDGQIPGQEHTELLSFFLFSLGEK